MADIREPEPVKLLVAMLSAYPGALAAAESELIEAYGPADLQSEITAHEFTGYYRDEMGHPLMRYFVSFDRLIEPGRLANIKRRCNELERQFADSGEWDAARPVNLDPGYVTPAKLVLASCKDFRHRIYLGGGIYAETTLGYSGGRWVCYDWTYPDYRTHAYQAFLTLVRDRLMARRKEERSR
ncbi:MAG: DUF4416 family protein [Anaerolineaceae bacterium]|nr:DUF4416 family protein [Anaerolineaceae bacterium]